MKEHSLRQKLAAEFLGSMILVVAAISPMILFPAVFGSSIDIALIANAIAVAFVLCTLIEIFGPISGAHFNPVVTVVMVLEKKVKSAEAVLFVLFQVIGGVAGTILSHLMFLDVVEDLLAVSDNRRSGYIYFGEIVGTFILVFTIMMLVKAKSTKIPITVGLLVGGLALATSSTMFANPQVTIARIFTNSIAGIHPIDGLIFIAMQLIGALLAYGVYKGLFTTSSPLPM